jgi:hypothetical protein
MVMYINVIHDRLLLLLNLIFKTPSLSLYKYIYISCVCVRVHVHNPITHAKKPPKQRLTWKIVVI